MQRRVKKWGNSAAARIPASVLEAAQVRLDQRVDVRAGAGRIVIMPLQREWYDFEALAAAIRDENWHAPVNMGEAVGGEAR